MPAPYSKDSFTEHRLPSGAVLYYRDEDHAYFEGAGPKRKRDPDGEWCGKGKLTGVTTVVKPFDWEPGALMGWAVRVNIEGVAALFRRECLGGYEPNQSAEDIPALIEAAEWLRDPEQIKRRLRDASLTDEDVREEAAERGTGVHEQVVNALAAGAPVPDMSGLTAEQRGHGMGVVKFWLDHEPEALQAEAVVADLGLGIAGRLDFRGTFGRRCDESRCPCHLLERKQIAVVDEKTGKHLGPPVHAQVAGYDHCARVSGYGPSDMQFILKTWESGEYRLIRSHATREDFLTAIEIYRRAAAIRSAANKDEKVWADA